MLSKCARVRGGLTPALMGSQPGRGKQPLEGPEEVLCREASGMLQENRAGAASLQPGLQKGTGPRYTEEREEEGKVRR